MFGLEWSKKTKTTERNRETYSYSDDIVKHVSRVVPLMWGEHCLECAVPECYRSCTKFEPRDDKRCKRFLNGIEKVDEVNGMWGHAVKITFKEWAKVEAIFLSNTIGIGFAKKLNALFDFTTVVSKILPTYYPRRFNYLYKEYITRKLGRKGKEYPEFLLLEVINPQQTFHLIVQTFTEKETSYRTSLAVLPGFNRFIIPYSDLNYQEGVNNYISVFPENDAEVTMYLCTLDLVTLNQHVSDCLELPKVKCVVWDLDNTVWDGILSEDENVILKQEVVSAIKELDRRGILNSISSKNNFEEAMQKLKEFNIHEYFLCSQINWDRKSNNIKRISQILDIGIDTIAFVDDMEYEREEVAGKLPFVRVFDANHIDSMWKCSGFDVPVTEACRTRRKSYMEIAERNSASMDFEGSLESFIKTCKINVILKKPEKVSWDRCNELIQRTNQLNLSGERLSFEEMSALFEREDIVAQSISVSDRYGDYGLVGVAIYRVTGDEVVLEHFVLSCRAARKLVEQSYMEKMIQYFKDRGIQKLSIKCAVTAKNTLLRQSIEDVCGTDKENVDNSHYTVAVDCSSYISKYKDIMSFELR